MFKKINSNGQYVEIFCSFQSHAYSDVKALSYSHSLFAESIMMISCSQCDYVVTSRSRFTQHHCAHCHLIVENRTQLNHHLKVNFKVFIPGFLIKSHVRLIFTQTRYYCESWKQKCTQIPSLIWESLRILPNHV